MSVLDVTESVRLYRDLFLYLFSHQPLTARIRWIWNDQRRQRRRIQSKYIRGSNCRYYDQL